MIINKFLSSFFEMIKKKEDNSKINIKSVYGLNVFGSFSIPQKFPQFIQKLYNFCSILKFWLQAILFALIVLLISSLKYKILNDNVIDSPKIPPMMYFQRIFLFQKISTKKAIPKNPMVSILVKIIREGKSSNAQSLFL